MIEYRIFNMTEKLIEIFEEQELFVAEESFGGMVTHVIYSQDDIADILSNLNLDFECKDVEETGWQEKWKEYVKEDWLTDDIFFIFEPKTFPDGRKTIYINPALAFGTGAHPTTQIAARLLQKVANNNTVLDVGSGSGILAILAEKCGASNVEAFDIDHESLPNCKENVANNDCSKINPWSGTIDEVAKKNFGVVVANIISSVLIEISPMVNQIAKKYIVYSGILASEYDEVAPKLVPKGGEIEGKLVMGEWSGMLIKVEGGKCTE